MGTEPWTMPAWMEQFRDRIQTGSSATIEEALTVFASTGPVDELLLLDAHRVEAQIRLLARLYESHELAGLIPSGREGGI